MRKLYLSLLLLLPAILIATNLYSQVEQTWTQRWTTYNNDAPIAVKATGSAVYVLGVLNQYATTSDVILIKYSTAGVFQWAQTYNGPGNNQDSPEAMSLDGAGNIYIVGKSTVLINNGSSSETFTLKYNSSGALLWSARYFRPDTYPSELNSVAVDASGNVYVAGSTIQGEPFEYDFMTIKYNSSGVQQWLRTYNGTAKSVDMLPLIALDASGNAYICGESQGQLTKGGIYTIKTYADVVTIKYDPNGNTLWTARYNAASGTGDRPKAIVLDASANIYITGETSSTNVDFLTLKYNSSGILQWASRYNGWANGHDGGKGLVVNGNGEVYATGYTDGGGGVYNYLTQKYSSSGAILWQAVYNGPVNGSDVANAIGMDAFGSVYVTGESQGSFNSDFLTVKYSPAGAQLWALRYNGPGNAADKASAVSVYTPTGPTFQNASIYVTGASPGVGTGVDIATIRYSQPTVISPSRESSLSLSNYPNPFTSKTTIAYHLPYDGAVSIIIYDAITGRQVQSVDMGTRKAGDHTYEFESIGLRNGNFIYKIITDTENGKFIESKVMSIRN